jgi:type VI protein secretion system component VasK
MLAGLQGAILLIAAKRADAVSAEQALAHLNLSRDSSEILQKVERELARNTKLTHDLHALHAEMRKLLENPNSVKE